MRLRKRFGYFGPDAWYEAVIDQLVTEGCEWVDVGGGKSLLPSNEALAASLSERCKFLCGVDPSENINNNTLLHEKSQCMIEDYRSNRSFDLATMRMVAEHVGQPQLAIASLSRLVRSGGKLVIYTPYRWSPSAIAASITPLRFHQFMANFLWASHEEDVFPTVYRMNTRRRLRSLLEPAGFKEAGFMYLGHCTVFSRFRVLYALELTAWRLLRGIGVRYPECCLLAVYQKV